MEREELQKGKHEGKQTGSNHTALRSLGKAEPIWFPDASLGDWMLSQILVGGIIPLPRSHPTVYMKPKWKMGMAKRIHDLPR